MIFMPVSGVLRACHLSAVIDELRASTLALNAVSMLGSLRTKDEVIAIAL